MSDLFDRLLLLKRAPIFSLVAIDDLRHVAQALDEVRFFRGDRIFEINEQGDQLFILVSGKVGISFGSDKSAAVEIAATFGPGDCFGEMNLLDDLPRSATAPIGKRAFARCGRAPRRTRSACTRR